MSKELHTGLGEIISAVVESSPSQRQLHRLVAVCHVLATAFVRSKITTGSINHSLLALHPSDIAYDCIADLFQTDQQGNLVQVKTYFDGIGFSAMSDIQLLAYLRRLVFSKVNHGLFRLYNEADPVLGKIIRNIKLAVGTLKAFSEEERFGEVYLVPAAVEPLYHLPPFESSHLEREFRTFARPREHVPALMAKLSLVVRQQEEYCRAIPLMTLAHLIRALYLHGMGSERTCDENPIEHTGVEEAIKKACAEVLCAAKKTYVDRGKADQNTVAGYLWAVEKALRCRLIELDGENFSYYEALKAQTPDLSEDSYHRLHKSRVEYLGRMAFENVVTRLRKELEN